MLERRVFLDWQFLQGHKLPFFLSDTRTKTSDCTPVGVLGVSADPQGVLGRGAPHEYLTVLRFPPPPLKAALLSPLHRQKRKGKKKKLIQMLQRWSSKMKTAALVVQKTHELKHPAR